MKTRVVNSRVIWFIHHFIRSLWSNYIFGLFFFLYYFFKTVFSRKTREIYKNNISLYNKILNVDELIYFFKNNYKYSYDLGRGAIDHDNSKYEFFYKFGDCDDMALFSNKKLRKMSKNENITNISRVCIMGKWLKNWHYDTLYAHKESFNLFNYGNIKTASSVDNTFDNLNGTFRDKQPYFWGDTIYYCRCRPILEWICPFLLITTLVALLVIVI